MNKILALLFFLVIHFSARTQTATFITLDDNGNLYRVTISSSGCTSTPLNLCNNFTGTPLSIALDGILLYIVDNQGFLYKNTLTSTGTSNACTKLGKFPSTGGTYGLTVGPGGIVYAATGSAIEKYTPSSNTFATVGSMPSSWVIGGDLLFYQGQLYEAVKVNGSSTNNALIQINLINPAASTIYMNFNAGTKVFGFASVTVPCSLNQAYALSSNPSTTDIFAIDMVNKTQATTATCTLNYNVYDAASIAETQSATPPPQPSVSSPVNYCQFQTVTPLSVATSAPDTLRWYTQLTGGTSTGLPTPSLSTAIAPLSTNYYVSNFDTSTGCESNRSLIAVNVYPYPAVPTINPSGTNIICSGNALALSSSATTGNQWFLNGGSINGATNQTYSATAAGDYTVTVTGAGGCNKTSMPTTLNVTNASINYTGSPFCNTGTATVNLNGNTGGKFSATPTGLSIDVNTGTINLAASSINTYTITYTVGPQNCTFTTTVQVVGQTASINYSAAKFCKSSSVQNIVFATGSTLGGSFSASPSGLSIDANGNITPASSTIGVYTVTYSFGTAGLGCGLQTTTTTVAIVDATTSITNKTICKGDSLLFNGTYYKTAGTYPVTLTNATSCDSVATLNLTVEDFKLTLTATPNPVVAVANLSTQITATTTIASSVWQPSSLYANNISNQTINAPNNSFLLKVIATSVNGCVDSAQSFITVNLVNENIFIPNTFSPISITSAENKTLKVYGNSIKIVSMDIFNQWGNKIATMNNASNMGWDGTSNGKQQNSGVYTYLAKITFLSGKTIIKKGIVNLIR